MSKYLDKFRSTMPAVQGKQIVQLLNGMKDRGLIKSVAEYNTKLQQLTSHLKSTNPQPIFKFLEAIVGEVIDSDRFNTMVEAASLDIEAAFQEADNIAEVLELHKALYKLSIIKSLEKAINDLDKTITLYEFFNRDQNGFTQAQFNTFDETDGGSSKRTDVEAGNLFYDFRRQEDIDTDYDCIVDLFGKKLMMPTSKSDELRIVNITLVDDADTVVSARNVQQVTSELSNIVDQQKHSYWIYPVLVSNPVSGGIKIKIQLDLGGIRELNTIVVEPACPFPMILESIEYVGENSKTQTVSINSSIIEDTSYNLGGIETRFLFLTFRQDTVESAIYHKDKINSMWERVWDENIDIEAPDAERTDRLTEYLVSEIPDITIREMLGISNSLETERINAFQYTFGFDNIRIYANKYRARGLFVGKKFEVIKPGLIGLRTSEYNPTVQIGDSFYPQFSFEYYVVKYDYDTSGAFIGREVIPILPVSYNGTIAYERLFPIFTTTDSSIPNVACLRFTPDINSSTPIVTQNITDTMVIGDGSSSSHDYAVLVEGDDWDTDWTDSWSTVLSRINSSSGLYVPMTVYIKFHNPSINSIYTVSYQVSTRNTNASDALPRKLLDYVTLQDNFVVRCNIKKDAMVYKSTMYLVAIMRNNYIYQTTSASLSEYKLLASNYDIDKFVV